MRNIIRLNGLVIVLVALCLIGFGTAVQAQSDGGQGDLEQSRKQAGDLDRDRDQDQDKTKQYSKSQEQVRKNMRERIDVAADLTADERTAMHANVDECLELGISESSMDALFPGEQNRSRVSAQTMLRLQHRVIKAAQEGLPVEPVTTKLQEGRTQGVPGATFPKKSTTSCVGSASWGMPRAMAFSRPRRLISTRSSSKSFFQRGALFSGLL